MEDWKLVLTRIKPGREKEVADRFADLFNLKPKQAMTILETPPVVVVSGIPGRGQAEILASRLAGLADAGARIAISDEELPDATKLNWPVLPPILAGDGPEKPSPETKPETEPETGAKPGPKSEPAGKKRTSSRRRPITVARYNLSINEKHVFKCPHCGKAFQMLPLSDEELEEAESQAAVSRFMDASADSPRPASDAELAADEIYDLDELDEGKAAKKADDDLMNFAAFDQGLKRLRSRRGEKVKLPGGGGLKDIGGDEDDEDDKIRLYEEISEAPLKKRKKETLEDLEEDDGMDDFVDIAGPGGEKITAPPDRRTGRGGRSGSEALKKLGAEIDPVHKGDYGLVLPRITTRTRREAAADIIAQVQQIDFEEALGRTQRNTITVISGTTRKVVEDLQRQFKGAGIASRITKRD